VPPKSLWLSIREDRQPARTPPPTFLFLPIHLSKSPADLSSAAAIDTVASDAAFRAEARSAAKQQSEERRSREANSLSSIGLKTEGNLNPSTTGSPSGVPVYRRQPASVSTLDRQKRTEKRDFAGARPRPHWRPIGTGLMWRAIRRAARAFKGLPDFLAHARSALAGRFFDGDNRA